MREYSCASGENGYDTIFRNRTQSRLSQRAPRLRSGCAFKRDFRKLNAQSRTRVSRCYAAARTFPIVSSRSRKVASAQLYLFSKRYPYSL